MESDDMPWEWDGNCERCHATFYIPDGDEKPEVPEDAICSDCVWIELHELRLLKATVQTEPVMRYMRCFMDMCRRMGAVGEALRLHPDADPEDVLEKAKAATSLIIRLRKYVRAGDIDLAITALQRFDEDHSEPTS